MFSILLINHSYHSIPVFVSLIMTLWQPNGRLLSTVKEFYKILERAQRQTCYHARGLLVPEIPRERGRQPAEESRGRDESLYFPYAEESCRYVIEQLSRRWSPARPLFMNIFHGRNFLLFQRFPIIDYRPRKVANNRCVESAKIRVALSTTLAPPIGFVIAPFATTAEIIGPPRTTRTIILFQK